MRLVPLPGIQLKRKPTSDPVSWEISRSFTVWLNPDHVVAVEQAPRFPTGSMVMCAVPDGHNEGAVIYEIDLPDEVVVQRLLGE